MKHCLLKNLLGILAADEACPCRTWSAIDCQLQASINTRQTYRWNLDLDDLLRVLLVIQTISEHVPKMAQRPLDAVCDSFFLALPEGEQGLNRQKASLRTLSSAAPLLFAFSSNPYPTSSCHTPSLSVTLITAVTPTQYRLVSSLKSTKSVTRLRTLELHPLNPKISFARLMIFHPSA